MSTGEQTNWGWLKTEESRGILRWTAKDWLPAVRGKYVAPEEIDPRWMRIENQRNMGSCQGHALSTVTELCYWIDTNGTQIQFSRMFGYLATQKIDGLLGRDVGSTINGGRVCVQEYGICREEVFPYPGRYTAQIPNEAWEDAKNYKIASHVMCESYQDVFDFIASGVGGVEIGIAWKRSMDKAVVESFSGGGGGGHAVAFLGYSKRKANDGRNYLWLANSWGTNWGNAGWAEVAPAAIDQMFADRWTVMIGLTDLVDIAPRPLDFMLI